METGKKFNHGFTFGWQCEINNFKLSNVYRVVQLNFTPEIKVFYMLLERDLSIFIMTSLKQHIILLFPV